MTVDGKPNRVERVGEASSRQHACRAVGSEHATPFTLSSVRRPFDKGDVYRRLLARAPTERRRRSNKRSSESVAAVASKKESNGCTAKPVEQSIPIAQLVSGQKMTDQCDLNTQVHMAKATTNKSTRPLNSRALRGPASIKTLLQP
jgi:hypothetical protein